MGQDKAERILVDYAAQPERYRNNLVGPEAIGDYYHYYFFDRQEEMDYRITAKALGHDDTLLNLLSTNSQATSEYHKRTSVALELLLYQSFMTAAKAFKAIDAPTQGVIVPFGDKGREIVAKLYAAFDVEQEFEVLRAAQQYTVNVFPHILQRLQDAGALREVQADTRVLCLDERFYSQQFGLATEPVSLMEPLHA